MRRCVDKKTPLVGARGMVKPSVEVSLMMTELLPRGKKNLSTKYRVTGSRLGVMYA